MERRVRDDDTADGHGGQARHGAERAGATYLNLDLLEAGPGELGGEFMGDRPTRRGRSEPEAALQREVVHLVDDTVDVISKRRTLRLNAAILREHRGRAVTQDGQRVRLKPERGQPGNGIDLRLGEGFGQRAPGVGEEFQRARSGNTRIELAQRPGGRITRIGEGLLTLLRVARVEGREIRVAHVDLAADFEDRRSPRDSLRNIRDGAGVFGDILPHLAIAPRRGLHQHAVFIAQREREPVDLGLGRVGNRHPLGQAQIGPHPPIEIRDILVRESVLEAEHANFVGDLSESVGQSRADL